jgi:hypothetical protein
LAIDGIGYIAGLLRDDGVIPWDSPSALSSLFGQMTNLLKPDLVPVSLEHLLFGATRQSPDLLQWMAAGSRPLAPLKALLADDHARDHVARSIVAIAASVSGLPILLEASAPATLAERCFAHAHGMVPQVEGAKAAMYVADYLRSLAGAPLDTILFAASGQPDDQEGLRTLAGTARHFGWSVGVRSPAQASLRAALPEVDFWVDEERVSDAFGLERSATSTGLTFVHVLPDAVPERVLAGLATHEEGVQ